MWLPWARYISKNVSLSLHPAAIALFYFLIIFMVFSILLQYPLHSLPALASCPPIHLLYPKIRIPVKQTRLHNWPHVTFSDYHLPCAFVSNSTNLIQELPTAERHPGIGLNSSYIFEKKNVCWVSSLLWYIKTIKNLHSNMRSTIAESLIVRNKND